MLPDETLHDLWTSAVEALQHERFVGINEKSFHQMSPDLPLGRLGVSRHAIRRSSDRSLDANRPIGRARHRPGPGRGDVQASGGSDQELDFLPRQAEHSVISADVQPSRQDEVFDMVPYLWVNHVITMAFDL